jgi:hypothetical protein
MPTLGDGDDADETWCCGSQPLERGVIMSVTTDMLKVIQMAKPTTPLPDGLKVTALQGPNTLNSAPTSPALAIGSFTMWPLSYIDNRVSFGMAMYDPKGNVVRVEEKRGARYIYKITIDGSGDSATVSFWGQGDQKVTMTLPDLTGDLAKQ